MKSTPSASGGGTPRETGWLPDCVYTGGRFESGLAFFADPLGRISRFSREPADLAAAKRLSGQAALPGLVNAHSHLLARLVRGHSCKRNAGETDPLHALLPRLSEEDLYDTARLTFLEMLHSGITCVGEFHELHHQPDGTPYPEPDRMARAVLRAARDTGIRIALHLVADAGGSHAATSPRTATPDSAAFLALVEAAREYVARDLPGDDAWIGVAVRDATSVPPDFLKAVAAHAHSRRMRLHVPISRTQDDNAACVSAHGRSPVAYLADLGLVDKRFTAVHAGHITDDEARVLGEARAAVCLCPTSARARGDKPAPIEPLLAAGAIVALGSDTQVQMDLLEDARLLEYQLRTERQQAPVLAADPASLLIQLATASGARCLGASTGGLEVGRPADFFTVNLYDPSIVGATPDTLLANIVFSLQRRAVRDVWIGARQRVAGARHPLQGAIIHRFDEMKQRLLGAQP